jgi:methylase of polypeptide subunit release factors
MGATYTPAPIVEAMVAWSESEGRPERVVDPGAGSGRFAVAAGRRFRDARLVAVELDPLAAILARAHLSVAGLGARSTVRLGDYRDFRGDTIKGKTLYLGNPPYVRHHQIEPRWKEWLVVTARERGLAASQLAGLHVHFFLATAAKSASGDVGAFITSAEWLDVNYGSLLLELFHRDLVVVDLHAAANDRVRLRHRRRYQQWRRELVDLRRRQGAPRHSGKRYWLAEPWQSSEQVEARARASDPRHEGAPRELRPVIHRVPLPRSSAASPGGWPKHRSRAAVLEGGIPARGCGIAAARFRLSLRCSSVRARSSCVWRQHLAVIVARQCSRVVVVTRSR